MVCDDGNVAWYRGETQVAAVYRVGHTAVANTACRGARIFTQQNHDHHYHHYYDNVEMLNGVF
jgi:hypothetical protein